jgi:hypothetical protein
MNTIKELKNRKVPIVPIDHSLDKFKNKILFPEKLAKTNEMLKTAKLPCRK